MNESVNWDEAPIIVQALRCDATFDCDACPVAKIPNDRYCGMTMRRTAANLLENAIENQMHMTPERFEEACKVLHDVWWEEQKQKGVVNNPDMIPYADLTDGSKEHVRNTVRRVIEAVSSTIHK